MKKKIFLAIADTGMGHRAISQAIGHYLEKDHGDAYEIMVNNVFTNDIYKDDPKRKNRLGVWSEKFYQFVTNHLPWFYNLSYHAINNRLMMTILDNVLGSSTGESLRYILKNYQPDIVVSLHSNVNLTLKKSLASVHLNPHKIILIADPFTGHIGWYFQKDYDLYIVNSENFKNILLRNKIPENKISICSFPLREKYNYHPSTEQISQWKKEFQIPENKTVVFFAGSGEGFKKIHHYVQALLDHPHLFENYFFIIVLGKNQKQKRDIDSILEKSHSKQNFLTYGFSHQMYELTYSSDIVVGKAGPSTMFEALICQKIFLVTQVLSQEVGNKRFLEKEKVGWYTNTPRKLVKFLYKIQKKPELLKSMQTNVHNLNIANGAKDIANQIIQTYEKHIQNNRE